MKYQYQITIGDWSGDGHDKSKTIIFNTNKSNDEINESYLKICKETKISLNGVDETHTILGEYEENKINEFDVETLEQAGVNLKDQGDHDDDGSIQFWGGESVFHLLMAMVKVNLPDLEYEILNPDPLFLGSSNFIGYGVFY